MGYNTDIFGRSVDLMGHLLLLHGRQAKHVFCSEKIGSHTVTHVVLTLYDLIYTMYRFMKVIRCSHGSTGPVSHSEKMLAVTFCNGLTIFFHN